MIAERGVERGREKCEGQISHSVMISTLTFKADVTVRANRTSNHQLLTICSELNNETTIPQFTLRIEILCVSVASW